MKKCKSPLLILGLLFASVLSAWSEPTFWKKDSPTPAAPKAPQVAPAESIDNKASADAQITPIPVEAPALGEPEAIPTPVAGKFYKKPTKAGLLSAVLPGLGHVYAGQPVRGLFFAGAFGVTLWQSLENFRKVDGKIKNANAGQLYGLAALVAYGFSVQDAYDSANRYNKRYHLKLAFDANWGPRLMIARLF